MRTIYKNIYGNKASCKKARVGVVNIFFFLLFVLLGGSVSVACAQGSEPFFNHLTTEQGLDNNAVIAVTQDATGFMWFGTITGLSRYDGSRFKNYIFRKDSSLPVALDYTLSLYSDSQGVLWAGTSDGLKRYNPQLDHFDNVPLTTSQKPPQIRSIMEDKAHTLWVSTSQGLFINKRDNPGFIQITQLASSDVNCSFQDSNGDIWVGTTKGLSRLSFAGNRYHAVNYYTDAHDNNSLSSNYITTIMEDGFHNIWIGSHDNGLSVLQAGQTGFIRINHNNGLVNNNIRTIIKAEDGNLWVGTQEGISIIDPLSRKIKFCQHDYKNKNSLSKNSIYSIFQDKHGIIWVGTYYGGVNYFYANSTDFKVIRSEAMYSLDNDIVSSIAEGADNRLWIGTEGGGLNVLDRNTGQVRYFKNNTQDPTSLGSNLVRSLYIDKEQNVWCGTHGGGLNVLPYHGASFIHYLYHPSDPATLRDEIFTILEDDQHRLWVGSNGGLLVFAKSGTTLTPINTGFLKGYKAGLRANYLLKSSDGKIWVASEAGLYTIDKDSLRLISDQFSVNCLQEDNKGNIWACLNYQGLASYSPRTNQLQVYDPKVGFPANSTYGLLEDKNGYLWVSSNNGLVRFDPKNNTSQVYTTNDGLPGNEFNIKSFLKASDGTFFFGGFFGITYFYPEKIRSNTGVVPIVFTGLSLFNKEVSINGPDGILKSSLAFAPELRFKYNQNVITIDFALLNFIKSNKNKFSYWLEGFDKGWNTTNNPYAMYTNLSPGKYTFWVKGANNDGLWSQPVSISLQVLPPIWRTWYAYVIYTLIVLAIIFLLLRYVYLRALIRKEEELHQTKLSFFTNISHEIRTRLSLIIAPIERLIETNSSLTGSAADKPGMGVTKGIDEGKADLSQKPDHLVKQDSRLPGITDVTTTAYSENAYILQQLKNVHNNSNRLLQLVDELMDFRKAETNHLQLHLEKADLVPFLQSIYETFREISLSKNISISFTHQPDSIPLYFSKVQLEKVFFNLMSNAFKFTPEGGRIELMAEAGAGTSATSATNNNSDDSVIITVRDNGRGIAPEHLHNLFENYFQVPDYNVQNTGYGIGLALSKSIVELHEGTISVESKALEKGQVTTFKVTLFKSRLAAKAALADNTAATADRMETAFVAQQEQKKSSTSSLDSAANLDSDNTSELSRQNGKRETILIAEDNPELREMVIQMLGLNYNVIESVNGARCFDLAVEHIPDLIVSDIMMPEMDGLTLSSKIKADNRVCHIPLILLTAKSAQNDQIEGLETGADLYITKPFNRKILLLSIRNLLAARDTLWQKFKEQTPQGFTTPNLSIYKNELDKAFLAQIIGHIEDNIDVPEFGVDRLAHLMSMSIPVLYKKLKAVTGLTVNDFLKLQRLNKSVLLLQQRTFTISEIAYMVGFNDPKYFSREFKKMFAKTPSEFLKKMGELEE